MKLCLNRELILLLRSEVGRSHMEMSVQFKIMAIEQKSRNRAPKVLTFQHVFADQYDAYL